MCRVIMGHLRVTLSYLRVTVGHPRVTMGHLRLTIGYRKATVVHIRVTIGYFFSISKDMANTTELGPAPLQIKLSSLTCSQHRCSLSFHFNIMWRRQPAPKKWIIKQADVYECISEKSMSQHLIINFICHA